MGPLRTITGHLYIRITCSLAPGGILCVISGTSPPAVRQRLFHQEPASFTAASRPDCSPRPSGRPSTARPPGRRSPTTSSSRPARGVVSMVLCLEDSIDDAEVAGRRGEPRPRSSPTSTPARRRAAAALHPGPRPPSRYPTWCARLGPAVRLLSGFVLPKFTEERGLPFLEALSRRGEPRAAAGCSPCRCWSPRSCCTGRPGAKPWTGIARTVDKYRDRVLALRLGVTDFCSAYGLRRAPDMTAYDVQIVAAVIADVVNVLGRADGTGFTVTGPVWEYFRGPRADVQAAAAADPFVEAQAAELRDRTHRARPGRAAAGDRLDRANGLLGKTCHPPLARRCRCTRCPWSATRSSATPRTSCGPSAAAAVSCARRTRNKMNEVKPHRAWAERTLLRAEVFGVAREDIGFVDLLAAGLPPADRGDSGTRATQATRVWSGTWVAERLGVGSPATTELQRAAGPGAAAQPQAGASAGLERARQARAAAPVAWSTARAALGRRVRELLGDAGRAAAAVVLGYAETATGLGHAVADGLGRARTCTPPGARSPGVAAVGGFEEAHCHATSHLLLPEDPAPAGRRRARWSWSTTSSPPADRAQHDRAPCTRRYPRDRVRGGRAGRHALGRGPGDGWTAVRARSSAPASTSSPLRRGHGTAAGGRTGAGPGWSPREHGAGRAAGDARGTPAGGRARIDLGWPAGLPDGGRHGFTPAHRARLEAALPAMAVATRSPSADGPAGPDAGATPARVLVLGFEELMYAPLRLAAALDAARRRSRCGSRPPPARPCSPSTTPATRSAPGWPSPPTTSPPTAPARATRTTWRPAPTGAASTPSSPSSTRPPTPPHCTPPAGCSPRCRAHRQVLLAVVPAYRHRTACPPQPSRTADPAHRTTLPRAPARTRLLAPTRPTTSAGCSRTSPTSTLEAPTEEREEAIQSGGAHYAESLPVEYQPTRSTRSSSGRRSTTSAARIARAVGAVTETVLAERGPRRPVLVSLARAGTPVGVLMRRWAQHAPRARPAALRGLHRARPRHRRRRAALAGRPPRPGRRRLRRRLDRQGRDHPRTGRRPAPAVARASTREIAVLADPGRCVRTYGTREDFLIPSACLNSTVSGLVSRTVLRADLVGPDDFHGAKFYRELAGADVSGDFLDAVAARFAEVADEVARRRQALLGRGPHARPGRAGPPSSGSARSTASTTSTWSSRASARPPGCCCAGCPGRSWPAAARAPTLTTCGCSPSSAACRSRRSTACRTPASG